MSLRSRSQLASERRALLAEAPLTLGEQWAHMWCERVRDEGRRVIGGWPGTLSEARGRTRAYLDAQLASRGMQAMSHERRGLVGSNKPVAAPF